MKHSNQSIVHAINAIEFERRERRRELFDLCKYDLTVELEREVDRLGIEIRLLEKMVAKLRKLNNELNRSGQASLL